jgi:hypothetical protein
MIMEEIDMCKNWALFHARQLLWHDLKIHPSWSLFFLFAVGICSIGRSLQKSKKLKKQKRYKAQKKTKKIQSPEKFITCSFRLFGIRFVFVGWH